MKTTMLNIQNQSFSSTGELAKEKSEIFSFFSGISNTAVLVEGVFPREAGLEEKEDKKIIPINFLESEKLELKKSFNASLEYDAENGLYIIDSLELGIYGQGRDEKEALKDFKLALEENYFSLKKDQDNLSAHLAEEWKNLLEAVREK